MAEYDEPTVEQGSVSESDELPLINTVLAARSPYVGVANEEELKKGAQAARYLREDALGKGGMGEVGLHRDRWIGRAVAVKKIHDVKANDAARRRFLREVRVQGQLEHPSIVPLYDFGAGVDGQLYFTMRRVNGSTLGEVIQGLAEGEEEVTERYSRRKLLNAFVSVCLAVHYGHTRGVLHRDLKPANIMLGQFGEVYVLDWGIAKVVEGANLSGAEEPEISRPGNILGTPQYMSPEQLIGRAEEVDARADVYSLGLILYEMLVLAPFHRGKKLHHITQDVIRGVKVRPSDHARDVAPELDTVCEKATLLDRQQRWKSAKEMADAVERFLDGDRDLERRRELAAEHGKKAAEATARAIEGKQGSERDRTEAMREVVRALALDPEQKDATRALVKLLEDSPDRMPEEVEWEIEEATARQRAVAAKMALVAFLAAAAVMPFALLMGIKSWAAAGLGTGAMLVAGVSAGWMARRKRVGAGGSLLLISLTAFALAMASCWMGPFVLVPAASASMVLLFATQANRKERPAIILIGALGVLAPFVAELLHLVPPAFEFRDGTIVLFPRGMEFPVWPTWVALIYTAVAFVVLPSILLGRVRDSLAQAERKLFLQAWQFRRLLADSTPTVKPKDRAG